MLGTLDLYNLDNNNQPADIVKSIVPVRNSLVFFAVTPDSHHQVSEVFSDKDRLSISGWFHGENIVRPAPYHEPALNKIKFEKSTYRI
jgi:Rps23 Pro-64 3,4-dihydroxylase Tpa1-like proline 4-hydroxylase